VFNEYRAMKTYPVGRVSRILNLGTGWGGGWEFFSSTPCPY